MTKYTYGLREAVFHSFLAANKRDQARLLKAFDWLAANPHDTGDDSYYLNPGRPVYEKRFVDWTIIYWSDHGSTEVRILQIAKLQT